MKEFLLSLLQTILVAAIPIATAYLCKFLYIKKEESLAKIKNDTAKALLSEAFDAVSTAVSYTNQTYVDTLKKSGTFSVENQKEALKMSYDAAMQIMSQEAKDFIGTAYDSLSGWLTTQIEAQVKTQKDGILAVGEVIAEQNSQKMSKNFDKIQIQ